MSDHCENCGRITDGVLCESCERDFEDKCAQRNHVHDMMELVRLRAENKKLREDRSALADVIPALIGTHEVCADRETCPALVKARAALKKAKGE